MKIKHFLSFVLVFFGILLVGEFYIKDQTERLYHSGSLLVIDTPKVVDGDSIKEITDEMYDICKRNDVKLYIVNESNPSLITTDISVYCFDNSEQFFADTTGVAPKSIKSVISGKLNISYKDAEDIDYIDISTSFLLLGDDMSVDKAYNEIGDSYDIINQMLHEYNDYLIKRIVFLAIFSGVIVLILGAFQSVNSKRTAAIKEIMGYSSAEFILKKFLTDFLLFAVYFVVSIIVLRRVSSIGECYKEISILFISIVLADLIPYFMLLHLDINATIKGKNNRSKVLLFGYIINIPIVLVCIVSVSAFFNSLNNSMTFLKAEKFYSDSNAVLANLDVDFFGDDPIEAHDKYRQYNEEIYRKYYDKAVMISNIDFDNDFVSDIIYVNSNGKQMIFDMLPKIKEYSCNSDYTIFRSQNSSCTIDDVLGVISTADFDSDYDPSAALFSYDEYELPFKYSIVGINQSVDSSFEKVNDPVLIINNTRPALSEGEYVVNKGDIYNTIMYEFTDADIEAISRDYDFNSVMITKVSEQFNYSWHYNKTELLLFAMFSCGIIFFEISILIFIIRNDFIINGVELCLYKLHGYSMIERFSIEWVASLSTIVIETIILAVLSCKYEFISNYLSCRYIIIVGSALLLFETVFIFYRSIKFEKDNICRILKGGAI